MVGTLVHLPALILRVVRCDTMTVSLKCFSHFLFGCDSLNEGLIRNKRLHLEGIKLVSRHFLLRIHAIKSNKLVGRLSSVSLRLMYFFL